MAQETAARDMNTGTLWIHGLGVAAYIKVRDSLAVGHIQPVAACFLASTPGLSRAEHSSYSRQDDHPYLHLPAVFSPAAYAGSRDILKARDRTPTLPTLVNASRTVRRRLPLADGQ